MFEGKKSISWDIHDDVIVAHFTVVRITEEAQATDAFNEMEKLALESVKIGRKLLLNLSSLQFMSSTGLAHLVKFRRSVVGMGVHLRLCALSPLLKSVLTTSGLGALFDVHATVQDALAAFKTASHEPHKS